MPKTDTAKAVPAAEAAPAPSKAPAKVPTKTRTARSGGSTTLEPKQKEN